MKNKEITQGLAQHHNEEIRHHVTIEDKFEKVVQELKAARDAEAPKTSVTAQPLLVGSVQTAAPGKKD